MLRKSLYTGLVFAGLLVSAGCGGGGGGGSAVSGGGNPPPVTPSSSDNATALFHVNVVTGNVSIQALNQQTSNATGLQPHAVFTGSAITFSSTPLLDQGGDAGLKVLSVTLKNNWGVPIGQRPDGSPTGLKVRFSNFTNVNAFSDLRPKTTVSKIAGTGTAASIDGAAGSATFNGPAGVAYAGNGVLYVTDYAGQYIRKIANGYVSTLAGNGTAGAANGTGTSASFNNPYGIAVNPVDGAVFVADYTGNRIRRITPDGQVSTVAGTGVAGNAQGTGAAATFNHPIGIAFGFGGAAYVTETGGEDIRKIVLTGVDPKVPASYTVSRLVGSGTAASTDGTGSLASFNNPTGIASGPDGTLYVADRTGNKIRRIDTSGNVSTIAGTGVASSVDGSGKTATFNAPRGIAYVNGALVVSEALKIRQLTLNQGGSPNTPASWTVATLAGSGATGKTDGSGDVASFTAPQLITADLSGNIVEADSSNVIRRITPNGGVFPIGIPSGTPPAELVQLSNADGTIPNPGDVTNLPYIQYAGALAAGATSAAKNWTFVIPNGVTAFEFTTTVEADSSILAPPGAVDNGPTPTAPKNVGSPDVEIRTLAGGGSSLGYLDGSVVNARFNGPEYIATDQAGNVFVADQYNAAIRRISLSGNVSTIAGHVGGTPGLANGPGNVAAFSYPSGIAVTPDGSTVYVCDTVNNQIRRIALSYSGADPTLSTNWYVNTIAGTGSAGGTYSTAPGSTATFNSPVGITLDPGGNLYVTESAGNRVRRLQFAGGDPTSSTNWRVMHLAGDLSGTAGLTGTTDGLGAIARFSNPTGIACDRSGILYVADTANHRIRQITPDGKVSTLAGGLSGDTPVAAYADGPAVSAGAPVARLSSPTAICVDSAGYVYVGDSFNVRIRRISPTGYVMTVAGTGATGPKDGAGNVAQFSGLASLAVAPSGTIYIGEVNNNGVRLLQRILKTGTQ